MYLCISSIMEEIKTYNLKSSSVSVAKNRQDHSVFTPTSTKYPTRERSFLLVLYGLGQ